MDLAVGGVKLFINNQLVAFPQKENNPMKMIKFGAGNFFRTYLIPFLATIIVAVLVWKYRNDVPEWWIIFVIAALVGHYYFYFRK